MDEKESRVGGGGEPEVSVGVESVGELPERGGKATRIVDSDTKQGCKGEM